MALCLDHVRQQSILCVDTIIIITIIIIIDHDHTHSKVMAWSNSGVYSSMVAILATYFMHEFNKHSSVSSRARREHRKFMKYFFKDGDLVGVVYIYIRLGALVGAQYVWILAWTCYMLLYERAIVFICCSFSDVLSLSKYLHLQDTILVS